MVNKRTLWFLVFRVPAGIAGSWVSRVCLECNHVKDRRTALSLQKASWQSNDGTDTVASRTAMKAVQV